MAEKVEAWKAKDGTIHETEAEANDHDFKIKVKHWYEKNPLSASYIDREDGEKYEADVSLETVLKWIEDNKDMILYLI